MTTTVRAKRPPREKSIEDLAKKKARNGTPVHPGLTSTTTPAGIIANDPSARGTNAADRSWEAEATRHMQMRLDMIDRTNLPAHAQLRLADLGAALRLTAEELQEAEELIAEYVAPDAEVPTETLATESRAPSPEPLPQDTGEVVFVGIDLIHPHPDNRHTGGEDLVGLAESLKRDKQQQAITVRVPPKHWGLPPDHLQLVFGERRWRAAKLAGLEGLQAIIRTDLDDAKTLELIAVENGQRKDLTPIEKAKLITKLCAPIQTGGLNGGSGLTREEAAKRVGLESGSAASNLVRLLELPKVWQDRVASGELPESWARLITPYIGLAPVMKELESHWKDHQAGNPKWNNAFQSRAELGDQLEEIVMEQCPRIDRKVWNGRKDVDPKIDAKDLAVREKLGIVEIQMPGAKKGQTETVSVATNAKAYQAIVDRIRTGASKAAAEKAGRDDQHANCGPKAKPKPLTPAQLKAKKAEQAEHLANRIQGWRHKLLRRECIRIIDDGRDSGMRMVLAYACRGGIGERNFYEVFLRSRGLKGHSYDHELWKVVAPITGGQFGEAGSNEEIVIAAIATQVLSLEASDPRMPIVDFEIVDGYAAAIGVDVAAAWKSLQADGDPLLEEFFLLHQTEQLKELAAELHVHLVPTIKTRAQMAEFLASVPRGSTRRLPLPKSIAPVAAAAKPKGRKAKKGAA